MHLICQMVFQAYYDTIINMRRTQLEEMRQMVLARAAGLMTSDEANNIEVNTTLEEEEEEEEDTSKRPQQRPKTASNTTSGGRTPRKVSIVERRSKACSTDSSDELQQASASKQRNRASGRVRSASNHRSSKKYL